MSTLLIILISFLVGLVCGVLLLVWLFKSVAVDESEYIEKRKQVFINKT